jgi:hypothetical protein
MQYWILVRVVPLIIGRVFERRDAKLADSEILGCIAQLLVALIIFGNMRKNGILVVNNYVPFLWYPGCPWIAPTK